MQIDLSLGFQTIAWRQGGIQPQGLLAIVQGAVEFFATIEVIAAGEVGLGPAQVSVGVSGILFQGFAEGQDGIGILMFGKSAVTTLMR